MKSNRFLLASVAILCTFLSVVARALEPLPALAIDLNNTSVSGLSSGAFMTSQFYMANSAIMTGAGIVAGGPYLCAQSWALQDYLTNATTACMNPLTAKSGPNTPVLVTLTKKLAHEHLIDPLTNLANDKIYLFSGQADNVVTTKVVDQTRQFFSLVGVPQKSMLYRTDVKAGHAMITANQTDSVCNLTQPPFVNDCGFTQAWDIFNHIYANLTPPTSTAGAQLSGRIIEFDQAQFVDSPFTSMSKAAYVYVPAACEQGGCRLHIVFHGCKQGAEVIGDKYYAHTGYNPIADVNHFVVLYPQVKPSSENPFNPQGCWDFWGYSDPVTPQHDYYSKQAPQIRAVRAMVDRLARAISTSATH